jgi:hypothetical protein
MIVGMGTGGIAANGLGLANLKSDGLGITGRGTWCEGDSPSGIVGVDIGILGKCTLGAIW